MRTSILTLLCTLLFITALAPASYAKDPPARNPKSQAFVCPCPCDPQQAGQWLAGQLDQLGNELGPIGLQRANEIAKALRDIADDLKKGKTDLEGAIARMEEQLAKLEKLVEDLKGDMEEVEKDETMTPKRKKSRLAELQKQLNALGVIINGVENKKGEKVKPGLKDLIDCMKKCLEAQQNPPGGPR